VTLAKLVVPPILYYAFYVITRVADYLLFFLPINPTIKTFIVLILFIIGLAYYFLGYSVVTAMFKIGDFFQMLIDWFMTIVGTITEVLL
jgi:hypothetical protein